MNISFLEGSPLFYIIDNFIAIIGKPFSEYSIMVVGTQGTLSPFRGESIPVFVSNGLMLNLVISVTAGTIWMILVVARKELGYYFAKTLFQTATHKEEESKKVQYLIKSSGRLFSVGPINPRGFIEYVASNLQPGTYPFYSTSIHL